MNDEKRMGDPIRVLILGDGFDRSERHVIAALSRRGVEVKVVFDTRHDEAAEYFRSQGVPFAHLVCRSRVDPRSIRAIRRELAAGRFHVMHCYINRPLSNGLWAALGDRDLKRVAYRGTEGHVSRYDPASWMTYLNPRLDRIACVSDAVRRYLMTVGVSDSKLSVIYKGHDPEWYEAAERSRLAEFGIPDDAFVVGCIANVRPVKGIEHLIRAWDLLPPGNNAHLLLIGEVREQGIQRLLDTAPHRERLHAVGVRSDAAALQGACNLAAMVSIEREGLPRAILEGQALGVPALVTRVGGMPEIVTDGVNGFVVEPRDAAAIAAAITRASSDPAALAEMRDRSLETCTGEFSINMTIERTLAMYEELAYGAPAGPPRAQAKA